MSILVEVVLTSLQFTEKTKYIKESDAFVCTSSCLKFVVFLFVSKCGVTGTAKLILSNPSHSNSEQFKLAGV